jgi:hypothetical protein
MLILDPVLLYKINNYIFVIIEYRPYLLLDLILFNNYSTLYLVNSKDLIIISTFRSSSLNNIVEVGTQSIPIVSYKTRLIKGILNRLNSLKIVNLKLLNIIVVKGFYINIISKALLFKKGL